ncbi:hypothetical protein C361_02241 [Cryptococcus neoformans Tu259-1]|uniref:Uncharacterized protein n=1 Tax=Cryptococcus neoformans Tu259-1 TaxID=1230072 RepID=A0A854QED1_CRYNE|nr:hypothetical protein C361_02241 [Cryptococcus neoformans var. grubii Tu259-1]
MWSKFMLKVVQGKMRVSTGSSRTFRKVTYEILIFEGKKIKIEDNAFSHHISIYNIYNRHHLLSLVEARTDDRSSSLSVSPPADVSANISLAFLRLDGRVEGVLPAPPLRPPRLLRLPLHEPPLLE